MRKITILGLILISLLLLGTKDADLIRLTVINKSGTELAIWLQGQDDDTFYYLTVPKGSKESPTVKEFTILRETYDMRVQYVESWDPVYGYSQCGGMFVMAEFRAFRNNKLNFAPCNSMPPNKGEPSMRKLWYMFFRRNDWRVIY